MTHSQQPHQTIIIQGPPQSQALPALVNFMCFPGLGQLIQGRPFAALMWWTLHGLAAASCLIAIGFILWPLVWIACVIDAAIYKPNPAARPAGLVSVAVTGLIGAMMMIVLLSYITDRYSKGHNGATAETPAPVSPIPIKQSPAVEPPETATAPPQPTASPPKPAPKVTPPLVIESWRFSQSDGFVRVAGEVTNTMILPLDGVTAVATFYTTSGSVVATSEAVIAYQPVLSGQTSPFEIIDTANPEIASAKLTFKYILGGTIASTTRDKLNAPSDEELAAKRVAQENRDAEARAEREALDAIAREIKEEKDRKIDEAKWRTWHAREGGFSVEAKFKSYLANKIRLEKRDGKVITVDFDVLTDEDIAFIREEKWLKAGE